jgi:hypothetical protein
MRSWVDFDHVNAALAPLFLFSATFFPISQYPAGLQAVIRATPLYQGVSWCAGSLWAGRVVHARARRLPRGSARWRCGRAGSSACSNPDGCVRSGHAEGAGRDVLITGGSSGIGARRRDWRSTGARRCWRAARRSTRRGGRPAAGGRSWSADVADAAQASAAVTA